MKIKTRLTLSAFTIVTVAIVSVASVMTWIAGKQVETGLSLARSDQMVSLQNVTRTAVDQYARSLNNQILDLANQERTQLAAQDFSGSFGGYALFAGERRVDEHRAAVDEYYQSDFLSRYTDLNPGSTPDMAEWVTRMSDNAVTLQNHFIAGNPASPDQRANLDSAPVASSYNNYHERYHPQLRRFQQRFDLDDILILHPETGTVVYSVRKQADLGTSLTEGPFSDSPLASLYRQALELAPGESRFIDFAPYAPTLGRPVGFLATPIVDAGQQTAGILVFRLNSEALNRLVTYDYDWRASGLGDTGTTFLVGPDGTARSNSRLLLQDAQAYRTRLQRTTPGMKTLETILAMRTPVARQRIASSLVDAALAGETGTRLAENSWGEPVLAAFGPVDFLGQRWGVISEIHRSEALAEVGALNRAIRDAALVTAAFLAIAAALAGWGLARSMTRPMERTVRTLNAIADGDGDLTQRLDNRRGDELGELASAFNRFVEKIHDIVVNVQTVNARLTRATGQVDDRAREAIRSLSEQNLQTDQVSTAMTEMAASIQEVSRHTSQADQLSRDTADLSGQGVTGVNDLADTVQRMDGQTEQAMRSIARLNDQTRSIGTILEVIRAIAEQTNLLALNAAIEAARAGEHGRGFAVVADEVRTLANRTQHSTEEIHLKIEALQSGSGEAVAEMEAGRNAVAEGVEKAASARDTLARISGSMDTIQEANLGIASAVEEQARVASEISESLLQIKRVADQTSRGSEDIGQSVAELGELNRRLQSLVGRFRTRNDADA